MKKSELIDDIKIGYNVLANNFDECDQFLCDEILELLPFVSKEGLVYFNNRIKQIRETEDI